MKLYSENGSYKLYHGSMLDMLDVIPKESIGSIVTDPPYGLTSIVKRFGKEDSAPAKYGKDGSFARLSKGFMGKEWDGSGIEYNIDTWRKCYEVLKPGGYLLAFGGSRTFHRIACAIEDAGFEIRDTIMWLYGSGFPKSMNIGLAIDKRNGVESEIIGEKKQAGAKFKLTQKLIDNGGFNDPDRESFAVKKAQNEWAGWGTALKPAFEPIIVARKPFKGSCVDNVIKWGVGGINIDECRVGDEVIKGGTMPDFRDIGQKSKDAIGIDKLSFGQVENAKRKPLEDHTGRFPANVILTYDQVTWAEVCGDMPYTKGNGNARHNNNKATRENRVSKGSEIYYGFSDNVSHGYEDSGSACRYFYCAKASAKDRDEGLNTEITQISDGSVRANPETGRMYGANPVKKKNIHPTVKPTELMQYLIRLVTPKGETVLDPFNGSGSTGKAVMYENRERNADYNYIGIELTEEYLPIAKARIEYAEGI